MSRRFGGIWITLSDIPADEVDHILKSGSGSFSLALPRTSLSEDSSCLALISYASESVEYLAVATAISKEFDFERKIQIGPVKEISRPILNSELIDSLPARFRKYLKMPTHRVAKIPPATWAELLNCFISKGWMSTHDIRNLKDIIHARSAKNRNSLPDAVVFERDAVATAFQVFGGSVARKTYISSSVPSPDAPFIQRLRHSNLDVIEDSMIQHDIISFPGLRALSPAIIGAIKLKTDSGTLTVLNANRTNIEKTLGVDLVYYNHQFESFVLVQYKRLSGKEPVYRPKHDSSLSKQMNLMRNFEKGREKTKANYASFRLIENPFFFKLCKNQTPGDWNGRMLQGMYFPLILWELLLESPNIKGLGEAIVVGFHRAKRRFSNSDFTHLLSQGWLGTASVETKRIENILVQQLNAGHSVIAAIHEPKEDSEYIRGSDGRFASNNDETAV